MSTMTAASFDTFKIVKDLQAAGMPEGQATAVMAALRDARDLDLATLATKADVLASTGDLKQEIAGLRVELYKVVAAQAAFILTGVSLIVKFLH
jgi:hypothetical protein